MTKKILPLILIFVLGLMLPQDSPAESRRGPEDRRNALREIIRKDTEPGLVRYRKGEYEGSEVTVTELSTITPVTQKLEAGTLIHVQLIGEGRLDDPGILARISAQGAIKYPYIGEVKLIGLTPEQASDKIEKILAEDYIKSPEVIVSVQERATYFFLGEIMKPGEYPLRLDKELTISEALALAGGPRQYAGLVQQGWETVKLIRTEEGKRIEYRIPVKELSPTFVIKPDDIIVYEFAQWEDKGYFYVLGEIAKPGKYPIVSDAYSARKFQDLSNVFQFDQAGVVIGASNVLDAILIAEGFTDEADRNRVWLRRKVDGEDRIIKRIPVGYMMRTGNMSRNQKLEDGDVIIVSEAWF